MPAFAPQTKTPPEAAAVLTKAVIRAADRLQLSKVLLSKVLGVSASTVTRLYSGAYKFDPGHKEWDLALLFLRLFRSLDSIVPQERTARQWLGSHNLSLNGRPLDLIRNVEGLVRVVQYLDASRGLV